MTAIASVYTPDGFVIGADGRLLNPNGTLESDINQKIFPYSAVNVCAAGGWCGATRYGDMDSLFDLKTHTLQIEGSIATQEFESLEDYAFAIASPLEDRFLRWLQDSKASLDPGHSKLARMLIVGYATGSAEIAEIHLSAQSGVWNPPGVSSPSLSTDLNVFSGKEAVKASMHSSGEIHPCSSLADGERLIKMYIERCAGLSDDAGNSIGGHIHIAAVTPHGVFWLIPPKP